MNRNKPLSSLFTRSKKPNFLILIDQPCDGDQSDDKKNLFMQELLLNGFEFQNHYVGSSACSPSKMTLFTGQYPSLHGVTQTRSSNQKQLNVTTIPIMEHYFRKAGYQTFWKELADQVNDEKDQRMASLNKNDEICADEVVELLEKLNRKEVEESHQWVIFSSFCSRHRYGGMMNVFQTLKKTTFYQNTIVLFTSILGQNKDLDATSKTNNVYEKYIHVPMMIHNPALFHGKKSTSMLTSHVDILPTMLGLAGIDEEEIQTLLSVDYSEVRPLIGRDLTPLLSGRKRFYRANEPIYFMTGDEGRRGLNEAPGVLVESDLQPNHIEAVVVTMRTGDDEQQEVWKYARYYDDPQYWRIPGVSDVIVTQEKDGAPEAEELSKWITLTKTSPAQDEFELYNLTRDPLEKKNLTDAEFETTETKEIRKVLSLILEEQHRQKRLISRKSDAGNVAM
ncbi:sulfatase-like hydrolase/transferase [Bacillus sp. Cs-700]|uniref:sulfatase-like hydrolase/transferase n=1 Tax=Bacillus sp. Cs-700 TaxID=2589818 RepID=UPI001408BC82|nr:sulfatase-like hydrolase/transferase [Bacillus sp. Cs-700]